MEVGKGGGVNPWESAPMKGQQEDDELSDEASSAIWAFHLLALH